MLGLASERMVGVLGGGDIYKDNVQPSDVNVLLLMHHRLVAEFDHSRSRLSYRVLSVRHIRHPYGGEASRHPMRLIIEPAIEQPSKTRPQSQLRVSRAYSRHWSQHHVGFSIILFVQETQEAKPASSQKPWP